MSECIIHAVIGDLTVQEPMSTMKRYKDDMSSKTRHRPPVTFDCDANLEHLCDRVCGNVFEYVDTIHKKWVEYVDRITSGVAREMNDIDCSLQRICSATRRDTHRIQRLHKSMTHILESYRNSERPACGVPKS